MKHDIPEARLKEVTSWLQRRVSLGDACARLTADDRNVVHPTVLQRTFEWALLICTGIALVCLMRRIVNGPTLTSAEHLRSWLALRDYSSDELWKYDTGGDSLEDLGGECGYAVVREGEVIDFWLYQMN